MSRTLKRPMFKMGGAAGTGITSGLDQPRKQYSQGTDPYDRALKTTERYMSDMDRFKGETPAFAPSALPGFLTQFGLNLLSTPPQGNIFQTAATAAKDPFQTFQAATLKRQQDIADRRDDIFGTALASEYDLAAQKIKSENKSGNKLQPEVERGIIIGAQNAIFKAQDILKNPDASAEDKLSAERTIKVNQNILVKEIGVPPEYAAIISSAELFDAEMDAVVSTYNDKNQKLAEEYIKENPDVPMTEVLKIYPQIEIGSARARALTIEDLKNRFFYAEGGRAGFKLGTEPKMMESVAEQPKGEVQDLSYTELRARLPQEISNDIVMLLANSKQALLDFANIQTTEDIASFNQQYDVNLSMPSGA